MKGEAQVAQDPDTVQVRQGLRQIEHDPLLRVYPAAHTEHVLLALQVLQLLILQEIQAPLIKVRLLAQMAQTLVEEQLVQPAILQTIQEAPSAEGDSPVAQVWHCPFPLGLQVVQLLTEHSREQDPEFKI